MSEPRPDSLEEMAGKRHGWRTPGQQAGPLEAPPYQNGAQAELEVGSGGTDKRGSGGRDTQLEPDDPGGGDAAARIAALEAEVERLQGLCTVVPILGDVAHSLNNILTGAIGFTHLLNRSELAAEPRAARMLSIISGELNRSAAVTRKLVAYARGLPRPMIDTFDLGALVSGLAAELEPVYAAQGVSIQLELPAFEVSLSGIRRQIEAVVRELLENAREAIVSRDRPGWIRVRVGAEEEMWVLEVSDSGGGVQEPERVFDPFYTTREVGPTRGLGLAMAKGVMRDHGGKIVLKGGPEGAHFILRFPRVSEAVSTVGGTGEAEGR